MTNTSKFRMFAVFFAAVLVLLANACKKDEPEPEPETVTDIDGNVYHVVKIGSQDWLVENLKVTHYRNGEAIPNIADNAAWEASLTGAYCDYNNNTGISNTYGRLYNWYAVDDNRNIAPGGWHVATDADWTVLADFLGGEAVAGGKLKETGTTHWNSPNSGATNSSGFKALPGGHREFGGTFDYIGNAAEFWTATESSEQEAWCKWLNFGATDVYSIVNLKNFGYSVRCVRD